jgi:chaperonin GroES
MKMKPMGNLVLLKVKEKEAKTKGGIIIPDAVDSNFVTAEVVSAGPGLYSSAGTLIPMILKPGDTVMFYKTNVSEIELDGTKYVLMREQEVSLYSSNN